jgi:VCBS repeat-containing protein
MALGTPTKDYSLTMNHIDWNEAGSPPYSNDDWNSSSAVDGDSSNNRLNQSAIINSSDGADHTISMWVKSTTSYANQML